MKTKNTRHQTKILAFCLTIIGIGIVSYPAANRYISWLSLKQLIHDPKITDIISDRTLDANDIPKITDSIRNYSYSESHLTKENCDPEMYDCDNLDAPTKQEEGASYFPIGQAASEYHFIPTSSLSEYLSSIIGNNNYKYQWYQVAPDKKTIILMFTRRSGDNQSESISLEANNSQPQSIQGISHGPAKFY